MNCKAKSNAFEANLGKPRSCSAKYSTCPNPKAKRRKSSRPCKTFSSQSSRIIKTMIWTIWLKIWIITVMTSSKRPSTIISRGRRRSQTCAKLCIMLEAKNGQRARAERSHQFRQKKDVSSSPERRSPNKNDRTEDYNTSPDNQNDLDTETKRRLTKFTENAGDIK